MDGFVEKIVIRSRVSIETREACGAGGTANQLLDVAATIPGDVIKLDGSNGRGSCPAGDKQLKPVPVGDEGIRILDAHESGDRDYLRIVSQWVVVGGGGGDVSAHVEGSCERGGGISSQPTGFSQPRRSVLRFRVDPTATSRRSGAAPSIGTNNRMRTNHKRFEACGIKWPAGCVKNQEGTEGQ